MYRSKTHGQDTQTSTACTEPVSSWWLQVSNKLTGDRARSCLLAPPPSVRGHSGPERDHFCHVFANWIIKYADTRRAAFRLHAARATRGLVAQPARGRLYPLACIFSPFFCTYTRTQLSGPTLYYRLTRSPMHQHQCLRITDASQYREYPDRLQCTLVHAWTKAARTNLLWIFSPLLYNITECVANRENVGTC